MRYRSMMVLAGTLVILVCLLSRGNTAVTHQWGETFGPVTGIVEQTDTYRGLAVRAEPSYRSRILRHLAMGTKVEGFRRFSSGWVRLRRPADEGWIPVDALVPVSDTAEIRAGDVPMNCAGIRTGPSKRYPTSVCLPIGTKVLLSGVWSENNWAEVKQPFHGWVFADHISTRFKPYEAPHQGGYPHPYVRPYAYTPYPPVNPSPKAAKKPDNFPKYSPPYRRYQWGKRREDTPTYPRYPEYPRYESYSYSRPHPRQWDYNWYVKPGGGFGFRIGRYGVYVDPHGEVNFRAGPVNGHIDFRECFPPPYAP